MISSVNFSNGLVLRLIFFLVCFMLYDLVRLDELMVRAAEARDDVPAAGERRRRARYLNVRVIVN